MFLIFLLVFTHFFLAISLIPSKLFFLIFFCYIWFITRYTLRFSHFSKVVFLYVHHLLFFVQLTCFQRVTKNMIFSSLSETQIYLGSWTLETIYFCFPVFNFFCCCLSRHTFEVLRMNLTKFPLSSNFFCIFPCSVIF